jgi:hypothetical protein
MQYKKKELQPTVFFITIKPFPLFQRKPICSIFNNNITMNQQQTMEATQIVKQLNSSTKLTAEPILHQILCR